MNELKSIEAHCLFKKHDSSPRGGVTYSQHLHASAVGHIACHSLDACLIGWGGGGFPFTFKERERGRGLAIGDVKYVTGERERQTDRQREEGQTCDK